MAKEKPILFSAEMVSAILRGAKTITRRVVKPQPHSHWSIPPAGLDDEGYFNRFRFGREEDSIKCPYHVGDVLWVRETWRPILTGIHAGKYDYRADDPGASGVGFLPWRPSIFMPRAACRLRLEVVSRRVERLLEITGPEVALEGFPFASDLDQFKMTWQKLNGKKYPWESNPWIFRIEFKRLDPCAK